MDAIKSAMKRLSKAYPSSSYKLTSGDMVFAGEDIGRDERGKPLGYCLIFVGVNGWIWVNPNKRFAQIAKMKNQTYPPNYTDKIIKRVETIKAKFLTGSTSL